MRAGAWGVATGIAILVVACLLSLVITVDRFDDRFDRFDRLDASLEALASEVQETGILLDRIDADLACIVARLDGAPCGEHPKGEDAIAAEGRSPADAVPEGQAP